ncbi:NAD(P)H-quinone oxidoreductase subunit 4L [Blastococcus aggregatus]|jgi:NAD(P)H-quinone oxidoreductase subunit 4L|uniref:NADH-quinone oxidoreductase subunit K n=1 Tax=Blastococcus aggregatus TaxID=38502 RepID=A0A285V7Z8_9ACTN|nr:NADH-quinone oxidoreductase subunit K [Blastococcus aggregatus]SOC50143.1 NAD(P)H-quinone oxidoreductase subunit 4L [Blastococcus aggregatus]
MTAELVLQILLTVAVALVGVGLFGALSQQSIVMVMMGLELVLNGVLLAGGAAWYFLAPELPDAQVLVVVALVVMAVEMAMGFAVTVAIYRARQVDMVDMATDLRG